MKERFESYPEIKVYGNPDIQYFINKGRSMRAQYLSDMLRRAGRLFLNLFKSKTPATKQTKHQGVEVNRSCLQ